MMSKKCALAFFILPLFCNIVLSEFLTIVSSENGKLMYNDSVFEEFELKLNENYSIAVASIGGLAGSNKMEIMKYFLTFMYKNVSVMKVKYF